MPCNSTDQRKGGPALAVAAWVKRVLHSRHSCLLLLLLSLMLVLQRQLLVLLLLLLQPPIPLLPPLLL